MAIGVWLTHSLIKSVNLWQKADGDADNSADDYINNNNNNKEYNQKVIPVISNYKYVSFIWYLRRGI
jgi:hypothetical protein